jgi:hypothetical protein
MARGGVPCHERLGPPWLDESAAWVTLLDLMIPYRPRQAAFRIGECLWEMGIMRYEFRMDARLVAERVGFEPTVGQALHRISSPARSTTPASLRGWVGDGSVNRGSPKGRDSTRSRLD